MKIVAVGELFNAVGSMLLLLRRAFDIREQYIPVRAVKQSPWSSGVVSAVVI
jgi:hypothetical protein